ncbi:hypothetical protein S1OALGB6SA_1208 [Olavius algarvensis spirochete endosymbiont]|nr:hypothetical protein S1OALGB6SA_1208 [Olavius algarvensis spirochete endosymbiont]
MPELYVCAHSIHNISTKKTTKQKTIVLESFLPAKLFLHNSNLILLVTLPEATYTHEGFCS